MPLMAVNLSTIRVRPGQSLLGRARLVLTCPYQKLCPPQKTLDFNLAAVIVTFPYAYRLPLLDATYN